MPTNLALDDQLITQAKKLGRHRTKREAVNAALAEYVHHRRQRAVLALIEQIEFDPDYDYKAGRRKR